MSAGALDGKISAALWAAEDAAEATHGRLVGADSWIATGVSIDTRSLKPGDLFVALQDARDGHDFAPDAFAKGAAAALVSRRVEGGPLLLVEDVLAALRALAGAARDRSQAVRIAVTGSVGKTSVKEALALCLAESGPTHAAAKSFNNHFGVPLTLAAMPAGSRFGVFEIGMNHRGEIAPLAALVRPNVAIVTTIASVHVEHMGSLQAIAEEKADVFSGLAPGGAALIPVEAPHADILIAAAKAKGAKIIRFGGGAECEARLLKFEPEGEGSRAEADILGKRIAYRIGAPGAPWAMNGLATLAACVLAGADLKSAAEALGRLQAQPGRGRAQQVAAKGGFTLVDDSYNASPISVAAAIQTLGARAPGPGGRRIAALGDMLELGPEEAALHAGLAAPIAEAGIDLVFAAGPRMAALWAALPNAVRGGYAADADSLIPLVSEALRAGDMILVKGSNGSRMGKVVDALARLGDR